MKIFQNKHSPKPKLTSVTCIIPFALNHDIIFSLMTLCFGKLVIFMSIDNLNVMIQSRQESL